MLDNSLWSYVQNEGYELFEWAKCGEGSMSVVPTVLWATGAAALAQRLLTALFRRFVFRRVPLWELVLQVSWITNPAPDNGHIKIPLTVHSEEHDPMHGLIYPKELFSLGDRFIYLVLALIMLKHLLFIWMVIYSLHFWVMLVKIVKTVVEYCFDEESLSLSDDDIESRKMMQQWMIWMCGAAPLAMYIHTRPRPEIPPLMIWITTSPWQRREMGPYGYYLNRPLSSLQSSTNVSLRQQALTLRRAFSDSKIIIKEPPKKKRYSKSV